ncbi:UDP-N-acetylmuramoyl-tripeptide--D-alanyl-D-alanine ligase [Pseudonocardia sp.]|jgi:UDP-N-acetylmuramoyl-tripeptide--D-alanyl-D-alanine ligase|uniref:UDP-N-acetylmuramoyl-tripeptide--D-alanyl-D- alanine ligase n=1 Tax=Pseudonocardia sp. TaxID=60912 RepID=UPI0031FD9E98
MIEMTLAEVARVTGGRLHRATGDERVRAVEFDSRKVGDGGLFLALPGERTDGHDFAAAAVAAGGVAVLAAREVDAPAVIVPAAPPSAGGTYLDEFDPDGSGAAVLTALGRLARHNVDALPRLRTVGITGSSGKTSTKDLVATVLAPLGETVAPPGSFNNELGHPWTALRATADTRHLVLELSARGPGHIARLCAVAPPSIGLVLNVGRAHLGEFGSPEGVAQAKGELVESLPADGVAILNADDPAVSAMASRTAARVVRFGLAAVVGAERAAHTDAPPDPDVSARDVVLDAGRARFRLVTPVGEADVALQLVGEHHVSNALAAAAVALEFGGTPDGIAAALSAATPASRWRMEVEERADGVTVVNDAYNANPESMRAALRALAALARPTRTRPLRRTWAVLGPMAELGPESAAAHAETAATARELGVDRIVAVGTDAYGADPRTTGPIDRDAALALLRAELVPGDVVLVKASRSAGLDRLASALLADVPDNTNEQELVTR